VPFLGTRAVAFALVLAVYLTGLVAGSALYAWLSTGTPRPAGRAWSTFGLLEIGLALTTVAAFAALGPWLPRAQEALAAFVRGRTGSLAAGFGAHLMLPPLALLLVPATFLGAAFPAATRLACGPARVGGDVGAVAAANTLGGIVGTCLTGFVAVPWLGLRGALVLLATIAAAVGGIALIRGATSRSRAGAAAAAALLAVGIGGLLVPHDQLARAYLGGRGTLLAYEESFGGSVAVVDEPFFATSFRRLYIQGVSNSNDGLMSRRYMRLQALLPLVLHGGEPKSALVVGLGTGITCGALLAFPGLEQRVCVELLPAVVRAARHFEGNYRVTEDPRIELRLADGRHELLLHDQRWDLITLEPPPPVAAGVVNLYSRDFYDLCRRRLAPDGLMAQWLPLATQNDEDTRTLVRSFLDAFPHATLWTTELHEMLLVGSVEPHGLDATRAAARLAEPPVAAALAEVGVPDLAALLATYVTDRRGLEAYAGDAPAVTDDHPRIEHAGVLRPGTFAHTLAHVLQGRVAPALSSVPDGLPERINDSRERLLDFYQAAVYWYAGQPEQMEPLLTRVLEAEPNNAYFNWFVGR
jgi:spermidine synthase